MNNTVRLVSLVSMADIEDSAELDEILKNIDLGSDEGIAYLPMDDMTSRR